MRRNQDIWRRPQRVIRRQGFRIRDVEGGAADEVLFEGLDEGGLVDDLAAGDVGDVGSSRVGLVEECEFGGGEEVRCLLAVHRVSTSGSRFKIQGFVVCRALHGGKWMRTYVNGTATTNKSISCFKKWWTSSLLVPLYHSLGNSPS